MYNNFDFKIKDLLFSAFFEGNFLYKLNFSFNFDKHFINLKTNTIFSKLLFEELTDYLDGAKTNFSKIKMKINTTSNFKKKVYKSLIKVPYGKVISYKNLAETSGYPKAYQAVGQVLASNPLPIVVPCHRILKSDGTLGGYNGGLDMKKYLLNLEKAKF